MLSEEQTQAALADLLKICQQFGVKLHAVDNYKRLVVEGELPPIFVAFLMKQESQILGEIVLCQIEVCQFPNDHRWSWFRPAPGILSQCYVCEACKTLKRLKKKVEVA